MAQGAGRASPAALLSARCDERLRNAHCRHFITENRHRIAQICVHEIGSLEKQREIELLGQRISEQITNVESRLRVKLVVIRRTTLLKVR